MSRGTEMRADVLALFADGYGGAMTLARNTPGAYDENTGLTAAGSSSTFTGKGKIGDYRDGVIDGDLIKQGDRRITFIPDADTTIPQVADTITDPLDSRVYAVVSVRRRQLGLDWIAFTLQVR